MLFFSSLFAVPFFLCHIHEFIEWPWRKREIGKLVWPVWESEIGSKWVRKKSSQSFTTNRKMKERRRRRKIWKFTQFSFCCVWNSINLIIYYFCWNTMGVFYIFPQFTCVGNKHKEDEKDLQIVVGFYLTFLLNFKPSMILRWVLDKWSVM